MIRQREDEDGYLTPIGIDRNGDIQFRETWDGRPLMVHGEIPPPPPSEPWSIWHALWMVLSFAALVGFWVVFAVGVYSIARWW